MNHGTVELDLHELPHGQCRKCESSDRHANTENGLCSLIVSRSDGGVVRCVGPWAQQKLHFLTQYLGIFARGIRAKWDGHIHYVEICSGPGRCIARDTGTEMDGSALAVLGHNTFSLLEPATFLDYDEAVVAALNGRIARFGCAPRARAALADYSAPGSLARVLAERAAVGLSLVFMDPTDCSLPFAAVEEVASTLQRADLIINVAVGTDANRNLRKAILEGNSRVRQKYVRFLGGDGFFQDPVAVGLARLGRHQELRQAFRQAYCNALEKVGYRYFERELVENYYDLLFASRHPLGLKFWKEAQRTRPDRQRMLDL